MHRNETPLPRQNADGAPGITLPPRRSDRTGLYVHFPYCIQKCDYCDFYSLPLDGAREITSAFLERYRAALELEFEGRRADFRGTATANTVYFGGGTSSLMPADFIAELLDLFQSRGVLSLSGDKNDPVEITLEGNPENFTPAYLDALNRIGVTRVNTGIQTFQRRSLEAMNRYFDPERYANVLRHLDASPLIHIGADLIYGLPGQSEADFYDDLERLLDTRIDHLSLYSLTAEAGTVYARRVEQGAPPPDDELQTRIMNDLPDRLRARGFVQYEISNFARPDAACRHNLRYWLYESYMGLGPGAHGFDGRNRYGNARNLEKWLADPLHARPVPHEPTVDVALNLLRLTAPIPDDLIRDIWFGMEDLTEANRERLCTGFLDRMQRFTDRDLATRIEPNAFQWNQTGLLQLDDLIFEMTETLERAVE